MKKIFILMVVFCIYYVSYNVIVSTSVEKYFVRGDAQQQTQISKLDKSYLTNVTKKLSNTTFLAYEPNELQKGREFGSKGEQFALDYLFDEMSNISFDKIDTENLTDLEKPKEIICRMNITAIGCTIYNETSDTSHEVDCYIVPGMGDLFQQILGHFGFFNKSSLDGNHSYTHVRIKKRPDFVYLTELFNDTNFIETLKNLIFFNKTINDTESLLNFTIEKLEEKYNFTIEDLEANPNNCTSLPWFNETLNNSNYQFVLIDEDPFFNPDPLNDNFEHPYRLRKLLPNPLNFLRISYRRLVLTIQMILLDLQHNSWGTTKLPGIILYDFNNDTHDMVSSGNYPLPIIFINGTEGRPLYKNPDNYNISFFINQIWNTSTNSSNIIGQINGTNPNKTVILCSLYDCWWNQGTVDAAIGMGTVLTIAKYMDDYDITPKCNLQFIGFSGEEHGMKGAQYYVAQNNNMENISTVIDINQIGYPGNEDFDSTLNILTDRLLQKYLLENIIQPSNYEQQINENTDLKTWFMPFGAPSNVKKFTLDKGFKDRLNFRTICFLKDYNWTNHHRDGVNHTEGDVFTNVNWHDVNLTSEMIWNVTKFYAINPDCWFETSPTFTYYDTLNDDNDYYDTVNVSFTLNTSLPHERVTAMLILHPKFKFLHPAYPILYRYRSEKEFIVTPQTTTGYINYTLPKSAPKGDYLVHLALLNSTGDAWHDTLDTLKYDMYDDIHNAFLQLNINLTERFKAFKDLIISTFGGNIIELLERKPLQQYRGLLHDLLMDILALYPLNDEVDNPQTVYLHPPNDPPEQPLKPDGPQLVKAGVQQEYVTSTTDPNIDKVRYKWRWEFGDTILNWNNWSALHDSGEEHTGYHTWKTTAIRAIWVQAKDRWHTPNVLSKLSPALLVGIIKACAFSAPEKTLVNKPVQFQGVLYGAEPTTWEWQFSESRGFEEQNSTPIETYTEVENCTVTLKVTDSNENVYTYSKDIEVKYIISDFDVDVTLENNTISCKDLSEADSESEYTIESWTWDFGDGNVSYNQSPSHSYQQPGNYTVTLMVVDNFEHSDSSQMVVRIEGVPPVVVDVPCVPYRGFPGFDVMVFADVYDKNSGVDTVLINVTKPDGSFIEEEMEASPGSCFDFEYCFEDTSQLGFYFYSIWVSDMVGNNVSHGGFAFEVSPLAYVPSTPYSGVQAQNYVVVDVGTTEDLQHYVTTVFSEDVSLWLPMDETEGSGVPCDFSGFDNQLKKHGDVCQTTSGFFGDGFAFNGDGDVLEVYDNSSLLDFSNNSVGSWSLWLNCTNLSADYVGVVSKCTAGGSESGFMICVNSSGGSRSVCIGRPCSGSLCYSDSVDLNVSGDDWVHLVVLYNGSDGWDVYANGSYCDSVEFAVSSDVDASYLVGSGVNVTSGSPGLFFNGSLDEVMLFSRMLNGSEISSLWNASEVQYEHNFTGLADGVYNFTSYAGYLSGVINETETRSITVDTSPPGISDVSATPGVVGFGGNVSISATVVDNLSGVSWVAVNVTFPDNSSENVTLDCYDDDVYMFNFSNTWLVGQYNFTVWAVDEVYNVNFSGGHSFNVSAQATINVATVKDLFIEGEYINITDPPVPPESWYLTGRGLSWNEYYDASTGNNVMELFTHPVNYQENGVWLPINTSLTVLDTGHPAYLYGYRSGNERGLYNAYFKSSSTDSWPVAFAYNKSTDLSTNVVRTELMGVGYLDPSFGWAYEYLQNVQSSSAAVDNHQIMYNDVFNGTDLRFRYGSTGLKEEIILSSDARDMILAHPPSDYYLSDNNSYVVFITKLDYQNLNLFNDSGLLVGNHTICRDGVEFRDMIDGFRCALPLGVAYEENNPANMVNLTYRILQYHGECYLLSGLPVSTLTGMTFPVVIDPSLSIYTSSSDGHIVKSGTTYNAARNAPSGTVSDSSNTFTVGQDYTGQGSKPYYIWRGFLFFNTSVVPSNVVIDSATLQIDGAGDSSSTDFDVVIQNGQPTYPHDPLVSGDYDKDYYSGDGGSFNTTNYNGNYNNITLSNLSWLNLSGWTKLCLRSSRDIDGDSPSGDEYVTFLDSDSPDSSPPVDPKLVIVYRNQSKLNNSGNTNISGYLYMVVDYLNGSSWELDSVVVNDSSPRTVNSSEQLALDLIFNGLILKDNLNNIDGTYRVYAAFRDPDGTVLVCDDESQLAVWYEFETASIFPP